MPSYDAAQDPARPVLRVRPPSGWLNDPHGPVHWRGRWHVFFQHNPDSARHGVICWGHASSEDLVAWRDEPVALRPTPGGIDAVGCWTGCLVVDDGTAVIAYTAVAANPADAVVALATSSDDDLAAWTKEVRPVAVGPPDLDLAAFRDPFVVEVEGRRLAVVGAGRRPGGDGLVLLYDATDLRDWRYLGVLLDGTDPVAADVAPADVWECPQLLPLGRGDGPGHGRWVLVVSLVEEPHRGRVVHLTGRLEPDGGSFRFVAETGGLVDHGHDFYAPAALAPARAGERTLLWGWVTEDRPEADLDAGGWAGALSVVRELSLDADGRLRSRPVAELADRRLDPVAAGLTAGERLRLPDGPVDVVVGGSGDVELRLLDEVTLWVSEGRVELHREAGDPYRAAWPTSGRRTGGEGWSLRLVVDASVLEVFCDDGPCFTERVHAGDRDVAVVSGTAHVTAHPLRTD